MKIPVERLQSIIIDLHEKLDDARRNEQDPITAPYEYGAMVGKEKAYEYAIRQLKAVLSDHASP